MPRIEAVMSRLTNCPPFRGNSKKDNKNNDGLLCERALKVALVVTETGKNASAGDYFTAISLGKSLKKFGWEISFLSRRGVKDWYVVDSDVDVLISLLDGYDIREIHSRNSNLIKVAWARNWIGRWISHPYFLGFNLVMASSDTACRFIEEKTGVKSCLLPLATDPDVFNNSVKGNKRWECDYCFTGSYWKDHREIIDLLDPESIPYTFKLFGKNWEKIKKLRPYYKGFVRYQKLPEVYRSTKVVVDDANRATKEYGSVNSRVFDASASGVLVITNGDLGAKETFNGILPVYRSSEELKKLLEYYLSDDDERKAKIQQLREFVLSRHTYNRRAQKMRDVLIAYISENKRNI